MSLASPNFYWSVANYLGVNTSTTGRGLMPSLQTLFPQLEHRADIYETTQIFCISGFKKWKELDGFHKPTQYLVHQVYDYKNHKRDVPIVM